MSPISKREYVQAIVKRYRHALRHEKSRILDELCATCCYHRKSAIRKFRQVKRPVTRSRKPGRPSHYDQPAIRTPLKRIWQAAHYPCSKRLKTILPTWIMPYQDLYGHLPAKVCKALCTISPATIDRLLRAIRVKSARHARAATKPGCLLRNHLPIGTQQWDESRPGFLEADTVAHCGTSLAGEFVYTLDTTDLATGKT